MREDDPPVYCDACHRRVWVWELHHLVPVGWQGDDSRAVRDWYVVWVKLCGDCHNTAHMILDTTRDDFGAWNDDWIDRLGLTQHPGTRIAHWGWNLAVGQGHHKPPSPSSSSPDGRPPAGLIDDAQGGP